MRRLAILLVLICGAQVAVASPLFPTGVGSTWEFEVREWPARGRQSSPLVVRITGTEKIDGQELLKLETLADGKRTKMEVISVNENGLLCHGRTIGDGKPISFNPPIVLMPASVQNGSNWEVAEVATGNQLRERFEVLSDENLTLPAGSFRAWRIRSEQPWPLSGTVERWFVPGIGFVKEIASTRGPGGKLLGRTTTLLTKFTAGTSAAPAATPRNARAIQLEVAETREGEAVTEFRSTAPNIFVRCKGENLPVDSTARLAWIAEDVGDLVPPNFVVDQTARTITTPSFGVRFTLSRPKDGWAAGKYRLELYLDDEVAASLAVTIRD